MAIKQISVFLENHPGTLEGLMEVLTDAHVDMRAMSMADTQEFGIVRMIVRDIDKTAKCLRDKGYVASVNEVAAAVIPDVSGGLYKVVKVLSDKNINLEYSYAFLTPEDGKAGVIFRVEDAKAADAALHEAGISIIDGESLAILD